MPQSRAKLHPLALAAIIAFSLIGLLSIVVVCGGFYFGLIRPVSKQLEVRARREAAATQLRAIGVALLAYANKDNGAFPEAGADLPTRLAPFLSDPSLIAPTSPPWFYYVPGRTTMSPATEILLYENPATTDGRGGQITTVTTYTTFVAQPNFDQSIDAIVLSDETPWTPHKPRWIAPK